MTGYEVERLEAQWFRALDSAARAVATARAANILRAGFCARELGNIQAERQWLASVRWP
jgi:hypothetical protein